VRGAVTDDYTSAARLAEQYSDSQRLGIRQETHRLYSENPVSFLEWATERLDIRPGMTVVDVGSGRGIYHALFRRRGAHVVGIDRSIGMAREAGAGCVSIVGDAQSLPLADAMCDRAVCNHVLYHVPDQKLAMRELRRIVRPGGRVMIATNGARNNERMYEIARLAASDLGRTSTITRASPFRLEDVDRVRESFANVTVSIFENAFRFPKAEPALRYWRSMREDPELEAAMRGRIDEIIRAEGTFRVPLVAGCFVAEV
jgi:ubiquinone/menaquinone biosynthesis C-methylase UbiE